MDPMARASHADPTIKMWQLDSPPDQAIPVPVDEAARVRGKGRRPVARPRREARTHAIAQLEVSGSCEAACDRGGPACPPVEPRVSVEPAAIVAPAERRGLPTVMVAPLSIDGRPPRLSRAVGLIAGGAAASLVLSLLWLTIRG
jgi:hypothetical protein